MSRTSVYQGDLTRLLEKWKEDRVQKLADGECARLPQALTDVGHTSGWRRGPRVIDLEFILPGTVIANFKFVEDWWRFPNKSGYHAGLFDKFEGRRVMSNGLPCEFSMVDQWVSKAPGPRGVAILSEAFRKTYPSMDQPSNRADEFYVVWVP